MKRSLRAPRKPLAVLAALFFVHLPAGQARAANDEEARCIEGYEGTQEAERAQNLRKARELALICSAEACHDSIKQSCRQWVKSLDEKIPSAKIVVRDSSGKALVSGALSVDETMSFSGSGREVALDPGTHSVTVSHQGYADETVSFELESGQKGVLVEVTLHPLVETKTSETRPIVANDSNSGARPLWPSFALGGVSVAGFATLAIFGVTARNADSSLESGPDACAATKTCSPERIQSIETNYTIANVGLIVGGVFLASAVGYTVWSLSGPKSDDAARLTLVPSGVRFQGTF